MRSASPRQHDLASPAQAYSRTQSSLGTHLLILSTPRSRGARWEVMVFWSCLGAIHVACARAKHRRMRRRFAHHDGSQRRPGGRVARPARATSRDPIPPYGVGWGPIRGGQFNSRPGGQHTDQALSFGRGAPRPVVPGVLRTPDGVVSVRPKAISRPRKAAGLLKSLVRSPSSSAARGPDGGRKVDFSERPIRARPAALS